MNQSTNQPTDLLVEKTIDLEASPERVWKAITDQEELAAWFPDDCHWDGQVGSDAWLFWEGYGKFAARCEVSEPPRYLVWRWARTPDVPMDESHTTLVEWTLTPREDGGTTLHLKESGFEHEKSCQENDSGWDSELGELVVFLGEPNAAIR